MGSALRLTIGRTPCGPNEGPDAPAAEGWATVVEEFEHSEEAMSRFRETSELTLLNRAAGTGRDIAIGRRLERAIVAADRARRITGGRFDPRILGHLDRLGYRGAALEDQSTLGTERRIERSLTHARVACRVRPGHFRVDHPLDLGGIGKGLALRWAAERLDQRGVATYLLEAGGDIVARGHDPDSVDWRIGIEDPTGKGTPLAVLSVADLAVTTSSIGVHAWTAARRRVHHLIDPATGEPGGAGLMAVTVADRDPAWAEVWSKSLFLAGRGGIAEVARARGLAAWWISEDRAIEMTPAARLRTRWVSAEM